MNTNLSTITAGTEINPGDTFLLKEFRQNVVYSIVNVKKPTEFSTTSQPRYEFDWNRMKSELPKECIEHFKKYETDKNFNYLSPSTKDTFKDIFIGFRQADVQSQHYNMSPIEEYNRWVKSNIETIKTYDSETDKYIKKKFCRVQIINMYTNSVNGQIPTSIYVCYKLLEFPK